MPKQDYIENLIHRLWEKAGFFRSEPSIANLLREAAEALEDVQRQKEMLRLERGY